MSTLPQSRVGILEFFETHLPLWTADPLIIGLTLEQVTDLQGFTTSARNQWDAAQAARVASKGATEGFYNAIDTLRTAGGAAISEIRAFAKSTANPDVYITAGIPAPASPTPAPPPDAPTNLTITMQTTGEAVLKWKVKQPSPGAEVFTVVHRRLNNTGSFIEFGATGEKTMIDATIPPGTQSVSYVLRARRGDQVSAPSEPVTQFLGIPGNQEGGQGEGQGGLSLAA
jgi:hypothetical protein